MNNNIYCSSDEQPQEEQPQEEQPNTDIDSPDFEIIRKSEEGE